MLKLERRYIGDLEFREGADGAPPELRGVVLKYGDVSTFGDWSETFAPGSLRAAADGVLLNRQHNRDAALARSPDTLELEDGPEAMRMVAKLPDTTLARDVLALVRARVLRSLSVEFHSTREKWTGKRREILEAVLTGIGVVDRGAYPGSTVEARSTAEDLEARWKAAHTSRAGWRPGL
ncbi:MAG: HK97 family phage prohead protease [Deltaproteobacteria bacterium]|nr:HK97 family phage prohead protease [Deltaproteobacteria bacterium]